MQMFLIYEIYIGNSSFSWWGAWLNLNPHKVIIASTEDWFGPELSHLNSSDIIPESWEKI